MPSFSAILIVLFVVNFSVGLMKAIPDVGVHQNQASAARRETRDVSASNLIPFPRVGRSQLGFPHSWGPLNLFLDDRNTQMLDAFAPQDEDNSDQKRDDKLDGLVPFARTGRTDHASERNGGSKSLWFGPRLGKRTFLDFYPGDAGSINIVPDCYGRGKIVIDNAQKTEDSE